MSHISKLVPRGWRWCKILRTKSRLSRTSIVLKIENDSEQAHFEGGTLNFQNLPKKLKSVENSPRKVKMKIGMSPKSWNFLFLSKILGNYNRKSYDNMTVCQTISYIFAVLTFSQRIFDGFQKIWKILKNWRSAFKMRRFRIVFYFQNYITSGQT